MMNLDLLKKRKVPDNDQQGEASKKQRLNPDVDLSLGESADLTVSSTVPVPLSSGVSDQVADNVSSEPESAVVQYLLPRPLSPAAADVQNDLPPPLQPDVVPNALPPPIASFELPSSVNIDDQAVPESGPEPPSNTRISCRESSRTGKAEGTTWVSCFTCTNPTFRLRK
jgi:hypothetical protein